MTTLLWAAFAVFSVLDWWAIARGVRSVEVIAKPGAMVALIGVVLTAGVLTSAGGAILLVALILCLAGDVLLLGDSEPRFLGGLSAFLLGHIGYAVLFVHLGLTSPWWGLVALLAVAAVLPLAVRIVRAAAASGGGAALGGALTAYIVVISAMAVLGAATGHPWLALGALVFVASDTILGFNRFVRELPWGRVGVMVTYLVAQGMLVHGALAALAGQ